MTNALVSVALALMSNSTDKHWGYQLSKESGVRSGVLYPILSRMLVEGWLEDGWEEDTEKKKRPARRYYVLTDEGRIELGAVLQQARADRRFTTAIPGGIAIAGGYA
jgi:PadR family transcriptional regulator, regulatory protein PadR